MIVNWKTTVPGQQMTAVWQGKQVRLEHDVTAHCWRMFIDGKRVKEKFNTAATAIVKMDAVMNRIIKHQMAAFQGKDMDAKASNTIN